MKYIDHSVYREARKQSSSQEHEPQQGRELAYAERARTNLLADLRAIYDRYPADTDCSEMELEDRVWVEAIEEELQERESMRPRSGEGGKSVVRLMRLIDMHRSQLDWQASADYWRQFATNRPDGYRFSSALVTAREQIEFWEEQVQERLQAARAGKLQLL